MTANASSFLSYTREQSYNNYDMPAPQLSVNMNDLGKGILFAQESKVSAAESSMSNSMSMSKSGSKSGGKNKNGNGNGSGNGMNGEIEQIRGYLDLLDQYSLHNFLIFNGKALTDTPEFSSFKRKYRSFWGR